MNNKALTFIKRFYNFIGNSSSFQMYLCSTIYKSFHLYSASFFQFHIFIIIKNHSNITSTGGNHSVPLLQMHSAICFIFCILFYNTDRTGDFRNIDNSMFLMVSTTTKNQQHNCHKKPANSLSDGM